MKRIVTIILSAVMLLTAVAPADVSAAPQSRQQTSASKKKKKAPAGKQPKKQGQVLYVFILEQGVKGTKELQTGVL